MPSSSPRTRWRDELVAAGAIVARVHVIAEGADHLPEPDRAGAEAVLRASGVDGPYLLAVSTLEPRKNLARLVDAYRHGPPAAARAGPARGGRAGRVGRLRARDRRRRGGRDRRASRAARALSGLYAGAAAFVYVPLAEGFGLPPLEAMAAGTPVVASTAVPSVSRVRRGSTRPGRRPARTTEAIAAGAGPGHERRGPRRGAALGRLGAGEHPHLGVGRAGPRRVCGAASS